MPGLNVLPFMGRNYHVDAQPRHLPPVKGPADIAAGILATQPQSLAVVKDRAAALQASLDALLKERNRAASSSEDLLTIQKSINMLSQALNDVRPGTAGSARQGGDAAWGVEGARLALANIQGSFEEVIKDSIANAHLTGKALKDFMKTIYPNPSELIECAQRILTKPQQNALLDLSGKALKDFMKTAYPDPPELIESAQRILTKPQQNALIEASKGLQRFAGVAKRYDAGNFFKQLERVGTGKHSVADEVHQAIVLGWAATGLKDKRQKKSAADKLQAVFLPALRILGAEIETAKADNVTQDQLLKIMDRVALLQTKGTLRLTVEQRFAVTKALAAFSMAQVGRAPQFRSMFMRFVDEEVRGYANSERRGKNARFSLEGSVLDLTHLQHGLGTVTRAPNSTRPAQNLDIDGKTHYVKEIDHGVLAAISENVATRINALTGQPTPVIHLARFDEEPRVLASQLVPGYQDLGEFLLDETRVAPMIKGEKGLNTMSRALEEAKKATDELRRLNDELEELQKNHADDEQYLREIDAKYAERRQPHRIKRYKARKEIYDLLPSSIHRDVAKAQFQSRLVANDDVANFEWYNIGITAENVIVTLDFGNAFFQGFGGKLRNSDNLERANKRARLDDPFPPNQVTENDHSFSEEISGFSRIAGGGSRTNIGGVPRSVPVAALLKEAINAETRLAEFGGTHVDGLHMRSVPRHEIAPLLGQLEGAFQLRFLPDEAIRRVSAANWPASLAGVAMPCTPDRLADILMARRDALINAFSPQELALWEQAYPERARAAYDAVAVAVAYHTGIYIDGYQPQAKSQDPVTGRIRANSI